MIRKDIPHDDLVRWLNERERKYDAVRVFDIPRGSKPFLYTRTVREASAVDLMAKTTDGQTIHIGRITVPDLKMAHAAAKTVIELEIKCRILWKYDLPHTCTYGYMRRGPLGPYAPYNSRFDKDVLFHCLSDSEGNILTYPGCPQVWSVKTFLEAGEAALLEGQRSKWEKRWNVVSVKESRLADDPARILTPEEAGVEPSGRWWIQTRAILPEALERLRA